MKENVTLAPYTTFRIGGPARYVFEAHSLDEVREAASFAKEKSLPLLVLGGGSNVLVSDEGVNGVVLKVAIRGTDVTGDTLTVGAGVLWDAVVDSAIAAGLWGIENLAGIPGTMGGAVVQNIGAYGAVLSETLVSVDAVDLDAGTVRTFSREEYASGYRMSRFKLERGRYAVVGATLMLSREPRPRVAYHGLAERFADGAPALAEVAAAVRSMRKEKFPDLAEFGTAGSFFLNPVLPEDEAQAMAKRFPGLPLFSMPEGGVKVPVAWFLDHRHGVLDVRGLRSGGAFVWPKQPLVIATARDATSADVDSLARDIAARVEEATGISLSREVVAFDL